METKLKHLVLIIAKDEDEALLGSLEAGISDLGVERFEVVRAGKGREHLLAQIKDAIVNGDELSCSEPDLIIKLGSEHSLEGALVLEASYAEIIFLDQKIQELSSEDIKGCIEEFHQRKRNFGK